ncbi:MAG: winged helix-turn-helix domain-containing protein [Xanthomonadales bacterium]|nr:winged helix-turn-helix domain-containing protein [Xanthomonadales bacterium]
MNDHLSQGDNGRFWLGPIEVMPDRLLLIVDGQERKLEPRAMELLVYGSERAGEVLGPTQILTDVWGDTHRVPEALHRVISQLRRALSDAPAESKFIETVPRRGYRFRVAPAQQAQAGGQDVKLAERSIRTSPMALIIAGLAVVALTWTLVHWLGNPETPAPQAQPTTAPPAETPAPAPEPD